MNTEGEPIIGATIYDEISEEGAVTEVDGSFRLKLSAQASYRLNISSLGYESQTIEGVATTASQALKLVLVQEVTLIDEIVVYGKSAATMVREQAYAVEVVESKGFKNLSVNANDILGRVPGVNIRQAGGVGSSFSLSLNGLSGNQVRVFLDGVPMDYFGSSLSLNNFSANLIERIEVYKGVVPIHLSSDALGGAINVVTNSTRNAYVDASYSIGSFNTHLASLNAMYRAPRSGFTTRIRSFYNYSDNDYQVPVKLLNLETGREEEEATWVRRFHDAYESRMGWAEFGFTATSWADQLMVGLIYSDNYKELQQPANAIGQAKIPYGEVASTEEKMIANFSYQKQGFLSDRLSLNTYLVAVFAEQLSRDTASLRYDWFGNSRLRADPHTGEVENRKTLLRLNTDNILANANAEYALNETNSLTLNYSLNQLSLQGYDPFKAQNNTQFSQPSEVTKQVLAASYTGSYWNERLKMTAFAKYYDYRIKSIETNYSGSEMRPFDKQKDNLGLGLSAAFQWRQWQFKASYERATRFPEAIELFGDGLNTVPSPSLLPEQSDNYNIGALFQRRHDSYTLTGSINLFMRDAKDFIIPLVQGIKVSHINSTSVLSRGVDLGLGLSMADHWVVNLSGTYLDLRDNNKWRNGQLGTSNSLYQARLPNIPYLFGNLSLSYRNNNLFSKKDNYSISLSQQYVHEFYYRWEVLASANKGVVPRQLATNLEMVYAFANGRYNASVAINNILDAEVYDNFQQLRPGRNFKVKWRFFLSQ